MTTALQQLTEWFGIAPGYHNIWGDYVETLESTQYKVLQSLGCSVQDDASAEKALQKVQYECWHRILDPVCIHPTGQGDVTVEVRLPQQDSVRTIDWKVVCENQHIETGRFIQSDLTWQEKRTITAPGQSIATVLDVYTWTLPVEVPVGYHLLELYEPGQPAHIAEMALIVTPDTCYLPADFPADDETIDGENRQWGPAVQLYALRSQSNWGMGDFNDLKKLVTWCGNEGAGVVGVNPLHELFPHQALHKSPYSPSSRSFFNTLYIDITQLPEFETNEAAQSLYRDPDFQSRLAEARSAEYVNYAAVAELKRPILELVYQTFKTDHLLKGTERGEAFQLFVTQSGPALKNFTVFQALHEHFTRQDSHLWSWQQWPAEYQNPENSAIAIFAKDHIDRVQFFQYLQWLADVQLSAVKTEGQLQSLKTGLYLDLAVGSDISGADVWLNQDLYALTMSVGAPPDECNQLGQNWGLPPYHPTKLKDVAYIPFIRMLRQNMKYAGALRIDHVLGLMRFFWIPQGENATTGAYVHYPLDDFLGLLALESHRNQCIVIGEDLGTVTAEVQQKMAQWKVLSYKLLYFERHNLDTFKKPAEYPALSLCALSTHDLPTLKGFWTKEDIAVRTALNLYPNEEFKAKQDGDRVFEWLGILNALREEGVLPEGLSNYSETQIPEMSDALMVAVHRYLFRCRSYLMVFQLEDVLHQPKQINQPGTVDEYPNWQRKITIDLEDWAAQPSMQAFLLAMNESANFKALASV